MQQCPKCQETEMLEEHRTYWVCNVCSARWEKPVMKTAMIALALWAAMSATAGAQSILDQVDCASPAARCVSNAPMVNFESMDWTVTTTVQPVQPQRDLGFNLLQAAYGVAAVTDVAQTAYCLGAQRCNEQNPLFGGLIERHGVVGALTVKGVAHAALIWTIRSQRQNHPKTALWAQILLTAAQVGVDVANYRTLK